MLSCVLPSKTMFAFDICSERTTALPVKRELATETSRVLPLNRSWPIVRPSRRTLRAEENCGEIVADAPGCGTIVTVDGLEPPEKSP